MLKKKVFWLYLLLASLMALPGWALPSSLIANYTISSKQNGKPVSAKAKIYYAGQKFRAEISSNANTSSSPVRVSNNATIIMDTRTKVGYLLDAGSRTAIKIDQNQMKAVTGGGSGPSSLADPSSLTDTAKLKAEIARQGGKQVGKANILGQSCTIWQMSGKVPMQGTTHNVTSKVWLADAIGMPLKMEANSDKAGQIMSMQATALQVNVPVNNSMFGVPAGYAVRNLQDMYKAPR